MNTATVRPAVAPDDKLLLLLSSLIVHVLVGQCVIETMTDVAIGDITEAVAMGDCTAGVLMLELFDDVVAAVVAAAVVVAVVAAAAAAVVIVVVHNVIIETPAVADVMETVTGDVIVTVVGCTVLGQVVLGGILINGTILSSPSVIMTWPSLIFSINNETISSRGTAFIFVELGGGSSTCKFNIKLSLLRSSI